MIRIGIVGIGAIAEKHALAIADLDHATLVGGCCRTERKGREFVQRFGGRWYPSAETLMDVEHPDVVTICTPSGAHLEPAVAAAERGIHVLCEKPLEIDLERAQRMIDAARRANVQLGCIFPSRFNPVVKAVHQAAGEGRFGPLALAVAYVPWWRDDAYYGPERWQGTAELDGGGALINQAIHGIDALQWIATAAGAGPPRQVFGYLGCRGRDPSIIEVEDTAVASLRFESGALGCIVASTAMWPGTPQRLHVAGRNGTAEIHEQAVVTWQFRQSQISDEPLRDRFSAPTTGGASDPMAIDYTHHARNIENFLDAIVGRQPLLIDGEEAVKSLRIVRGIYESAQRGEPVAI